jgi:dihydrofolate reductase / thymidylate synthase
MKTFNVILAVDINYGISKNGEIPWKSKTDIQFFKNMTEKTSLPGKQNIVIMGRKTFESLPNNYLPNRTNYVITRNKKLKCDNISTFDSFNKAIITALDSNNNVWVIGGAEIYDQSFRHKNIGNIYLTQFNKDFNCDLHVKLPNSKLITMNTIIDNDVEVEVSFIKFKPIHNVEQQYLNMIDKICKEGELRVTRNASTYSIFDETISFDLSDGFPLLTTKKMFWKGIVEELLFFIRGDTNTKNLEEKGVSIWKGNTTTKFISECGLDYEEGDMGPMYGWNWRHFGAEYVNCNTDYSGKGFDQLKKVIYEIKNDPNSRRILMTDFNPATASQGVLYPCHSLLLQFYVHNNFLDVKMVQRSVDSLLGLPFNIASTALLLTILSKLTNKIPGKVIITMGDCHIYNSHLDAIKTQLDRNPYKLPTLTIPDFSSIEEVEVSSLKDYIVSDYMFHPSIKAQMIV